MKSKIKRPFYQTKLFKLLLLIIFFIPAYSQIPYDPINTADVIKSVLSKPIILNIGFLLPIAKLSLLLSVIIVFTESKLSSTIFLGYYAFILIITGVFQNISYTQDYGFTWLVGNTIIMLIASAFCIYDVVKHKTKIKHETLNTKRLWVLAPMLLAFLMPYKLHDLEIVKPSFGLFMLTNEAGLTYCMITPVVLGVMILFSKNIYRPTFYIVSFIGFMFGTINMLTWFVLDSQNWWMGVLHLPLAILSTYALLLCRKNKINAAI